MKLPEDVDGRQREHRFRTNVRTEKDRNRMATLSLLRGSKPKYKATINEVAEAGRERRNLSNLFYYSSQRRFLNWKQLAWTENREIGGELDPQLGTPRKVEEEPQKKVHLTLKLHWTSFLFEGDLVCRVQFVTLPYALYLLRILEH